MNDQREGVPTQSFTTTGDRHLPQESGHRWICDRRGRRVRLLDPMRLQLLHRTDAIDRDVLDRMLNELEPGLARRMKWFLVPLVLAVAGMAAIFGALWAIGDPNLRASMVRVLTRNPGIYLPILFSAVIGPLVTARKHRERVPALMLSYRRCPHCAYDLHGLPRAEADGATMCPECACAWDLEAAAVPGATVVETPAAPTPVVVKIGIAAAVLLAAVLIAVTLFGPMSRGGTTPAATWLIVSGVMAGLGIVVMMLMMWKQGFGRR